MKNEKAIYWLTQIFGWFGFICLILFQNLMVGNVDAGIIKVLILNFILGICLSHTMRIILLQANILKLKIAKLIPAVLLLSVCFGLFASCGYAAVSDLFFTDIEPFIVYPYNLMLELILPFTLVFLFWNILYIAAIYLKNYEKEEVKNLRLSSAVNEAELNNLKSQLNPHFMFNAMNSIRALVDENPVQAKQSITQLSNLLRNTLTVGKRKYVRLEEEIRVVTDYLQLEKIRYEDRLQYEFSIPEAMMNFPIPALMLQTLVENGIKHGISQLPEGGVVKISVESAGAEGECLIRVENSGKFALGKHSAEGTGLGLENTRKRLQLSYGSEASLHIFNQNNRVICEILLPCKELNETYENHYY